MDGSASKQVCVEVLKALEKAIRCSQDLPEKDDLQLLRVTSPGLRGKGNELTEQILSEIKSVASRYAVCIPSSDSDSCASQSSCSLSLRDSIFDQTAETTDEALQHFNIALDRARKITNAIVPPTGALGPKVSTPRVGIGNLGRSHGNSLDIEKPQVHFPDYPIDNSDTPFVPPYARGHSSDPGILNNTPHANMRRSPSQNVETYLQELYKKNSNPDSDERHPYENEITSAMQEMSTKDFKLEQATVYKPMQSTPCAFISTEEELFNIIERLKATRHIAVDLENHSVRSFQGFTCLIQISTRKEDFVIDALRLRGSIHRALAPIFTDHTIVKVLHGADKDVQWLERDFGIYIVNMFDTGQAARLLKLPSASLSFLLSHFCDISGSDKKKFQLADWRQRPLPKEMLKYAQSDTHYLLYVFDRLRCELSKKDVLEKAWERSAAVSRKRHRKVRFEPGIAKHLAARHSLGFDKHQIRLLEELCKWRDTTAREEDESIPYVAPLKVLFGIVRSRDKARTVEGLLKHGFPGGLIPPLVYQNAQTLTELIRDALDAKFDDVADAGVSSKEHLEEHPVQTELGKKGNPISTQSSSIAEEQDENLNGPKLKLATASKTEVSLSNSVTHGMDTSTRKPITKENKMNSLTGGMRLKVTSTSQSALLDADSDSDGAHHAVYVRVQDANEQNAPEDGRGVKYALTGEPHLGDTLEDEKPDSVKTRKVLPPGSMRETNENGKESGKRKMEDPQRVVKVAEHSVYDLSDTSDGEQRNTSRELMRTNSIKDRIASAMAEIAAEQERLRKSSDFRMIGDEIENKSKPETINQNNKLTEDSINKMEEVISLREAARRAGNSGSKKRKRKEKLESSREQQASPLPAFDYENAIDEQRKKAKPRFDGFDPMRKLREERKPDIKRKVKKRRRGRGQSMSFKAS